MTRERFKEHFSSEAGAFIVTKGKRAPYRLDGQPLTAADRAIAEGKDPVAGQLDQHAASDPTK